jgi:aconitate hydratase
MGAELGVTTSIFPADEATRRFLAAQGREGDYRPMAPDADAEYDRIVKTLHIERDAGAIENIRAFCTDVTVGEPDAGGNVEVAFGHVVIDLDRLEPLAAAPSSPDNIVAVADQADMPVGQVVIGSCTNSSYQDLVRCAKAIQGRTVHPDVEMGIAPGSRQVMLMLTESGMMTEFLRAGARIIESACGPCIGQGFSPAEGVVSLRTFNRNFAGRTGTKNDRAYLVSPETAIAAAITGRFTDPRTLTGELGIAYPDVEEPETFAADDSMIVPPLGEPDARDAQIVRGPTIVKPPSGEPLPDTLAGQVAIKVGDKITTDHIMPAGAFLKYRSNVPEYAKYVFHCYSEEGKPTFAERALALKDRGVASVIVAGESYGQGSSREHAALCPMYLGVRAVIARAIERIHQANLVNFGILPLTFQCAEDYDAVEPGDELVIENTAQAIATGQTVEVRNATRGATFTCLVQLAPRQRDILVDGGLLNHTRRQQDA